MLVRFLNWLIGVIADWLNKLDPIDPPPPVLDPSLYLDEMKRAHPDKSEEELDEKVYLTCVKETYLYTADVDKNGNYKRNEVGNIFFIQATGKENEIKPGDVVYVYRWAFPVNGGSVRSLVWEKPFAINIKHFTRPS